MINSVELEQLVGIYAVANTPLYLYKQLQIHPAVGRLAETESSSALLERLQKLASSDRSVSALAEGYACLLAILTRANLQREPLPGALAHVAGLDWLAPILAWHSAKSVATTNTTVKVHSEVAREPVIMSGSSNSPVQQLIRND